MVAISEYELKAIREFMKCCKCDSSKPPIVISKKDGKFYCLTCLNKEDNN